MNDHHPSRPRRERTSTIGRRVSGRRRARPEVLILEGRRLLTTVIPVTSALDTGSGTLRDAIDQAATTRGPVEIDFKLATPATIDLTQGQLELTDTNGPVSIVGPGASNLTIDGSGQAHVLQIEPGVTASVSGLTMTGGGLNAIIGYYGGDVDNQGTVTMSGVTLTGGTAVGGSGLYNAGSATLEDCTISDNPDVYWGALENLGAGARMALIDCVVSGNSTPDVATYNTGIVNVGGTLSATGTTIQGNNYGTVVSQGAQSGGGGSLTLSGCTIAGNLGAGVVSSSGTTTIQGCSIVDGGETGVIDLAGAVTLVDTTISGNTGFLAGGVSTFPWGTRLSMTDCTISDNEGRYAAGGVEIESQDQATLDDCAIIGNTGATGGGLYNQGQATLNDCTISGNTAFTTAYDLSGLGGGIDDLPYYSFSPSSLALNACTISGNTASRDGGGIECQSYYGYPLQATLNDTIVAGNAAAGAANDISGALAQQVTGSYNLIGTGGSGGLTAADHNLLNVADPGLTPPGNYGGPTPTVALQPGSPALHAGTALPGLTTDQRGFPLDSPPDIGAFQSQPGPLVVDTAIDGLASPPGQMSLRQAVDLADVLDGGATITFDQAVFRRPATIALTDGPLVLSNATGPVTILGPGAGRLSISGGGLGRVLQVDAGATAVVSGLTITGGRTSGDGGGVLNDGTLALNEVAIVGDSADDGGGLYNAGTAVIVGSTFDGDAAAGDGGGIDNAGTLTLTVALILGNAAAGDGGGLYNDGIAALVECLVTGNAAASGGGIYAAAGGSVTLTGTAVLFNKKDNIVGTVTDD